MNFILKKIDAYAVRIVGEFDSFDDAYAAKKDIYEYSSMIPGLPQVKFVQISYV